MIDQVIGLLSDMPALTNDRTGRKEIVRLTVALYSLAAGYSITCVHRDDDVVELYCGDDNVASLTYSVAADSPVAAMQDTLGALSQL